MVFKKADFFTRVLIIHPKPTLSSFSSSLESKHDMRMKGGQSFLRRFASFVLHISTKPGLHHSYQLCTSTTWVKVMQDKMLSTSTSHIKQFYTSLRLHPETKFKITSKLHSVLVLVLSLVPNPIFYV